MGEHRSAGETGSRRARIAVIFGGTSSEHGVSCLTAASVLRVIDAERYEVVGIGITRSGRWVLADADRVAGLQITEGRLPEVGEDAADALLLRSATGGELAVRRQTALAAMGPVDLGFSLLHGPFGEDGTIQGLFEMMGTRYVGAGVLASAVGMDKHFMKLVFAASGLPVGPFATITPAEWERDKAGCLAAVAHLRYPLFVKPARGGSSLGISRVDDQADLAQAIELARGHDPKVVVEQGFVGARELECGVLGDLHGGAPQASAVAEIRMHSASGFYDFEAKYLPEEQVDLDVPAAVPDELAARVQAAAVRAFSALGCEGLARVDFFVGADGTLTVNEVNTMPGFTPTSMFPRMWAASGVDYPELVDRLVQSALRRGTGLR
ncbi:MAG TPA: D-alanine--D-alanine ligase family protein [Actinomycetales bacterium]